MKKDQEAKRLAEEAAFNARQVLLPLESPRKPRGFATMSPERVRAIASKGGKTAHALGTAHTFTREQAREAGRKGGRAEHASRGRPPATRDDSDSS